MVSRQTLRTYELKYAMLSSIVCQQDGSDPDALTSATVIMVSVSCLFGRQDREKTKSRETGRKKDKGQR